MRAAIVASTTASTEAQAASALFYYATGTALGGDQDRALDLISRARSLDPSQATAWINELAVIGQQHHGVLALIPALTSAPDTAPTGSPQEAADDAD